MSRATRRITSSGRRFLPRSALRRCLSSARINYQRWRGASKILLGFAIFLLILVIIPHNPLAQTRNNATRWLGTQTISFQPSEIAKLAVVVFFADSISKKRDKMQTLRFGVIPYTAVLGVISVLMLLEPHLSGTILILGIGIVMMIVGGIKAWLVGLGLGGVSIGRGALCQARRERHHTIRAPRVSRCGTTRGSTPPTRAIRCARA